MVSAERKIRYGVVGLGWFAQAAILPAFANTRDNSELTALVSGDVEKATVLAEQYQVPVYHYDQYDNLLQSGNAVALRIAANAATILAARLQAADQFIVSLLDQIRDEKVREALTRFRQSMSHSFNSTVRPPMQVGTMQ